MVTPAGAGLPALGISTGQTGHAAIQEDHCRGAAPTAHLGASRVLTAGEGVLLPLLVLKLPALLLDKLAFVLVHGIGREQPDETQVLLNDMPEFRNDLVHELAAGLPVAAPGIEHGLEFVNHEGHIAALPEHGRH